MGWDRAEILMFSRITGCFPVTGVWPGNVGEYLARYPELAKKSCEKLRNFDSGLPGQISFIIMPYGHGIDDRCLESMGMHQGRGKLYDRHTLPCTLRSG